ncbi:hypothetical protein BWI96_17260 [Siphonobacter sp. SORGH_AS_0500]|uniref:hypothetical protein n=1 Tax=Siphonobacter sp. SORGH_AS_0500 TaxID=1864824 RepID=UPI000CA8AC10|nr:hypothetical protein [Siphonobacter sp. SORGH_AS_0500]PKK35285.1 hypothetical protein BWI96_17260 [Siphonobacter sp. SORGH_AS_0500]
MSKEKKIRIDFRNPESLPEGYIEKRVNEFISESFEKDIFESDIFLKEELNNQIAIDICNELVSINLNLIRNENLNSINPEKLKLFEENSNILSKIKRLIQLNDSETIKFALSNLKSLLKEEPKELFLKIDYPL